MTLSLMVSCADQSVLWVSDSFADRLGVPRGTMSGSSVFELLEGTPSALWHGLFTGDRSVDERFDGYRLHRVGGSDAVEEFELRVVRYVEDSRNAMVTLRASGPGGGIGDAELLLEAEQRYGELLRGSFDAVIVHDGRSVLFMNAVACRLIGVDPGAVAGLAMASILEPFGIGREQRSGRVDDAGNGRVRLRLRQVSGDSIEVDASMALVSFRGRRAVQVVAHDLSSEHRSRWAESFKDLVEENVTDAVISTDEQLRIVGWNRSASELYGWSLADVVGKNIVDVLGPVAVDLGTSGSGDPADVSIGPHAHRHRDGHELRVEAAQIVLRDSNGSPWGVLEVSRPRPPDGSHVGVAPVAMSRARTDDAGLAEELHTAVLDGEIRVVYQPIVELDSLRLHHVEALARWTSATRGAVPPDRFIALAERCGAIDELGEAILERACLDVLLMHGEGIDVDLNVNLSVVQLRDPAVSQRVARILATTGFPPARLSIEVTEGVLLNDHTLLPLQALHDMGVRLVVDDFGTGYATFQYLTRFPVHALKVDASFVSGLGTDVRPTAIVRAVVNMSRELGVEVVAEGVETEAQRAALTAMNCRFGQGWLFDHGLPIEEFVARYRHGAPVEIAPTIGPAHARWSACPPLLSGWSMEVAAPSAAGPYFHLRNSRLQRRVRPLRAAPHHLVAVEERARPSAGHDDRGPGRRDRDDAGGRMDTASEEQDQNGNPHGEESDPDDRDPLVVAVGSLTSSAGACLTGNGALSSVVAGVAHAAEPTLGLFGETAVEDRDQDGSPSR